MLWFIATEAMLFVMLFFSYFYLWHFSMQWGEPPKLALALVMLGVLLLSSVILGWGELAVRKGREGLGRASIAVTIVLGLVFLAIQSMEYRERLRIVRPTDDAYGSIFYAITGLHGLHVALGVLMLAYVLIQPRIGANDRPPHHPMKKAALYWHFLAGLWLCLFVALLFWP